MNFTKFYFLPVFLFILVACNNEGKKESLRIKYPTIKKNPVKEIFFGDTIVDEYRILEQIDSPEVKKWFENQNSLYRKVISTIPNGDALRKDLEKYNYSSNIRADIPKSTNGRTFYKRYFLKENNEVLYYTDEIGKEGVELVNTTKFNRDSSNNFVFSFYEPSFDGRYLAIGVSDQSTEKSTILILNIESKTFLNDTIERAMYANVQWLENGKGFYYNQLKKIESKEDEGTPFEDSQVKFHILNTSSKKDPIIFSRNATKSLQLENIDFPIPYYIPESKKLIISVFHGSYPYTTVYSTDILETHPTRTKWTKLYSSKEKIGEIALYKDHFFVLGFRNNSNGILEKRSFTNSKREVVVEGKEDMVLNSMLLTKSGLYVKTLEKGINQIFEINPSTLVKSLVKLPFKGSLGIKEDSELGEVFQNVNGLYFDLTSWNNENAIYFYHPSKKEIIKTDIRPQGPFADQNQIVVQEIEVPGWDNAKIPLSIIYSKGLKLDGSNPTILQGYGAYGANLDSYLDFNMLPWLERGGVYAIAHVRGGGEKGDNWYKGGYKATKPNSWKDFISCAQYLINKKYTSPEKLAAEGRSAGGITVGMAILEKPELFKAALIEVGSLNPLRDEFSENTLGVSEFGTIKDSLELGYLKKMDVTYNISGKKNYPSILFTAGLKDPRVAAWQPGKAVARFQEVNNGSNLILFRVSEGGHYGSTKDMINDVAEAYSFLLWQLGHPEFQVNLN